MLQPDASLPDVPLRPAPWDLRGSGWMVALKLPALDPAHDAFLPPELVGRGRSLASYLMYVARPCWWIDKTHLNYFTWSSFSNLLGLSGFRIVERQTMYPMEQFIISGRDYTADDMIGRKAHQQVERNDMSITSAARLEQYGKMARLGRGREIVVVAVKE